MAQVRYWCPDDHDTLLTVPMLRDAPDEVECSCGKAATLNQPEPPAHEGVNDPPFSTVPEWGKPFVSPVFPKAFNTRAEFQHFLDNPTDSKGRPLKDHHGNPAKLTVVG